MQGEVERAVTAICNCHQNGGKVLVCGNGGSASDTEHIVGELVKQFKLPRRLLPTQKQALGALPSGKFLADKLQNGVQAYSLVSQTSLMTAVGNDTDATMIFAQQAFVYGRAGDILWGISTSGNSQNIVHAFQVAKAFGMTTIGMTGENPAAVDELCDVIFKVPETETYKIQELHLPLYHAVCLMVESKLFS